jgi:steroid 5-alpha reductase family enzyme
MGQVGNIHQARNFVVSIFVMVWGIRISGFLLFRILKTGKDDRFDEMRHHFFKFLGFWVFQILWVWIVSLPVTILNSPNVSYVPEGGGASNFNCATDIIGVILFAIGLIVEAVADIQKVRTLELD